MARSIERRDQCCLCGKTKEEVRKLIVGLHGAVCGDCIDLCNDILHKDQRWDTVVAPSEPSDWDGTVIVASEDRDVFPDALEARRALASLAELVRGYTSTPSQDESGGP